MESCGQLLILFFDFDLKFCIIFLSRRAWSPNNCNQSMRLTFTVVELPGHCAGFTFGVTK